MFPFRKHRESQGWLQGQVVRGDCSVPQGAKGKYTTILVLAGGGCGKSSEQAPSQDPQAERDRLKTEVWPLGVRDGRPQPQLLHRRNSRIISLPLCPHCPYRLPGVQLQGSCQFQSVRGGGGGEE